MYLVTNGDPGPEEGKHTAVVYAPASLAAPKPTECARDGGHPPFRPATKVGGVLSHSRS